MLDALLLARIIDHETRARLERVPHEHDRSEPPEGRTGQIVPGDRGSETC